MEPNGNDQFYDLFAHGEIYASIVISINDPMINDTSGKSHFQAMRVDRSQNSDRRNR